MKCIVTGGAGFIGSHIVEALHKEHEVIVIDDLSAGYRENLEGFDCEIRKCSILDNIDMTGVDVIFNNAASKKNICLIDPKKDLDVNAKGTLNLLQLAMKYKVPKFIHASTGSVYGEPYIFPTTEDHPFEPCSYYGVSKLAGERYVNMFHKQFGLNATIIRYFHVYGARQEAGKFGGVIAIFNKLIKEGKAIEVHGDGKQTRSFTYVKDVVKANLAAINVEGGVYNCASGIRVSINDLVMILSMLHEKRVDTLAVKELIGDIKEFDISNDKIKDELGVDFEMDLISGLKNFIFE